MKVTEAEYAALLTRETRQGRRGGQGDGSQPPVQLVARVRHLLQVMGDVEVPAPFDVILTLPWPPSVNASLVYGNRGRLVARKVIWAYRAAVCDAVAAQWPVELFRPLNQRLALRIVLYATNRRRRDLDNPLKQMLDSLATDRQMSTRPRAAVYLDDSQIDHVEVTRGPVNRHGTPYATVQIRPWP